MKRTAEIIIQRDIHSINMSMTLNYNLLHLSRTYERFKTRKRQFGSQKHPFYDKITSIRIYIEQTFKLILKNKINKQR